MNVITVLSCCWLRSNL